MEPQARNGKRDAAPDPGEAATLALMALGWTLSDENRADRLLAMTGMDADMLRAGVGDPTTLGAVLAFLADHEPDLLACADALDVRPETLIAAKEMLSR
ncbi:MAG: DUF3572 domain-containing protein [Sphingobium sp.]